MEKRSLVYVRVSGGPGQDTAGQKKILKEYLKTHRLPNVEWLEDEIGSSRKKRPVFEKMRGAVRAGMVASVVCYKYDRIGRSSRENLDLAEDCKQRGTDMISVSDGQSLNGPDGHFMFGLLSLLAEREWQTISDRTKAGMAVAKAAKKCVGGSAGGHSQRILDKIGAIRDMLKAGRSRHYIHKALSLNYKTVCSLVKKINGPFLSKKEAVARVPFSRRGKRYQQGVLDASAAARQGQNGPPVK